jgi:hypothetical protein
MTSGFHSWGDKPNRRPMIQNAKNATNPEAM